MYLRPEDKLDRGWGGGGGVEVQTDWEPTVCFGMESRCEFVSNENKELGCSHLGVFTETQRSPPARGGSGSEQRRGGRSERIPNSIKWKSQQELGTVTGTGLKCDLGMTAVCVPPLCEIQEGPGGAGRAGG